MINRYGAQFKTSLSAILKEVVPFISELDLQASAYALKIAKLCIEQNPALPENSITIDKACIVATVRTVVETDNQHLLDFFEAVGKAGVMKTDKIQTALINHLNLNTIQSARCVAHIVKAQAVKEQQAMIA